jgi:hypothetical protein
VVDVLYRCEAFTAAATAVPRGHEAGQLEGSDTGQARPFMLNAGFAAALVIAAVVADADAQPALPPGQPLPHCDGSETGHACAFIDAAVAGIATAVVFAVRVATRCCRAPSRA